MDTTEPKTSQTASCSKYADHTYQKKITPPEQDTKKKIRKTLPTHTQKKNTCETTEHHEMKQSTIRNIIITEEHQTQHQQTSHAPQKRHVPLSEDEQVQEYEEDTKRKRRTKQHIKQISPQQVAERKRKKAEAQQKRRAALTEDEKIHQATRRKSIRILNITKLTAEQVKERKEHKTEAQRKRRTSMSHDQKAHLSQQATARRRSRLENLSALSTEHLTELKQKTAEAQKIRRAPMSQKEKAHLTEQPTARKRSRQQNITTISNQDFLQLQDGITTPLTKTCATVTLQKNADLTEQATTSKRSMKTNTTTLTDEEQTNRTKSKTEAQRKRRAALKNKKKPRLHEENTTTEIHTCLQKQKKRTPRNRTRKAYKHKTRLTATEKPQDLPHPTVTTHSTTSNKGIAVMDCVNENNTPYYSCGLMNAICIFCKAKHFNNERPSDNFFTKCCSKGKVYLPPIRSNELIQQLLSGEHQYSKNFFENIRSINSSLAFASMGANISPPPGYGPYCFRINGTIYHRTGSLHPDNEKQRQFAQLYILDPDEAALQRLQILPNAHIHEKLMTQLSNFMASENPFADACKMLYEVENESIAEAQRLTIEPPRISMAIVQDRKHDPRRYNAPRANEVAFIFQNTEGEPPLHRDLIIHCRNTEKQTNQTEIISVLDPNLEPMVYPLLFPYGDQSWGINIPLSEQPECLRNMRNKDKKTRIRVTQMQYYGYRFAIRDDFNPFLSAGKLTQQYFVDAYIKTEANRLNYIRQNQKLLRVEKYKGLMDHLASENTDPQFTPGQPFILPSTFSGSPRNMHQNYQDAMAIVRKYGKPDLFITMTCNPKWEEITENLHKGQTSEFRPDLVARVFHLKLKQLLQDICKEHILGIPLAKIHVIEFQKRGLPHAHILLILAEEHKPKTTELIDKIVCAEIPDIQKFPRLHSIVAKHMIHGPCNNTTLNLPCMVSGKCSKEFPKSFENETIQNCDGYPKYRRRDNGVGTLSHGKIINNTWVVPYNPFLLLKYNSHINVEVCASIKSVKYLFKYVYKGHDCANVLITEHKTSQHDEIKTFTDSRYVTAPEAAWRLNAFEMHHQTHTIQRLEVHLPDEQSIHFIH
ncbi:uncharacterized protein LOC115475101 [Microcaecilia unicolor]|uniref:Uncharacterized protein LOC115475101 n=1 Tax=Microcaecilia unicolor TaxID=1415580 RepID=A0A6P7YPP6_9AMPH|nr:uncharacterized protein LOC115475101 [Microcaecilia unicolor]